MYKVIKTYLIIITCLFYAAQNAVATSLESCEEVKIGVVDFKELWIGLSAVKNIKTDLELTLKKAHQEFSEIESELRQENADLLKLANEKIKNSDASKLDKKRDSFERKIITVQKKAEKRQKSVNTAHAKAIKEIKDTINQVIEKIAEENKISIVIYKENILYHSKSLDITPMVLEKAENKTKNIRLHVGGNDG